MSDRRLVNLKTVTGLRSGTTDNAQVFQDLIPGSDIIYKLGTPAFRWLYVYAYESVITNNLNVGETINVKDVVVSESLTVPYLEVGAITDTIITDFDDTAVALNRNIVAPRIQATSYLVSPFISTMGFTQVDKLYASRSTDATSKTDTDAAVKVDGGIACGKRVWANAFTADGDGTFGDTVRIAKASAGLFTALNISREDGGSSNILSLAQGVLEGSETNRKAQITSNNRPLMISTQSTKLSNTNQYIHLDNDTPRAIRFGLVSSAGVQTEPITIQHANGYIGINKTVPTTELDIVGSIAVTGNESVGGTLGVTGVCTLAGTVKSTNTTDASTSTSTSASIQTLGGVAVAKKLVANSVNCDTTVTTVTNTVTGNSTVGGTLGVTGVSTHSGTLKSTNVTDATSSISTTCSIQTLGGLAVAKSIFAQSITSEGPVSADSASVATTLTSNNVVVNAFLTVGSGSTFSGIIDINNSNDAATSTSSTASIQTSGGAAVAKKLCANSINCDTTVSTVTSTVSGNSTIGGTLGVTGSTSLTNLTISGTLTVSAASIVYSTPSFTTLTLDSSFILSGTIKYCRFNGVSYVVATAVTFKSSPAAGAYSIGVVPNNPTVQIEDRGYTFDSGNIFQVVISSTDGSIILKKNTGAGNPDTTPYYFSLSYI